MSTYKQLLIDVDRRAKEDLCNHQIISNPVQSFHFRKVKPLLAYRVDYVDGKAVPIEKARFERRSEYNFTLTWTPGIITLTGDIGELVITHYNALMHFEKGLFWLRNSDHDYLLGKSNAKKEYDGQATYEATVHYANEQIIDCCKASRRYNYETHTYETWRHNAMRADMVGWVKSRDEYESEVDHLEDRPESIFDDFEEHQEPIYTYSNACRRKRGSSVFDNYEIPEEWTYWVKLWEEWGMESDPNTVLKASTRREIREWLEGEVYEYEGATRLLYERMDDYEPIICHQWEWRSMYQIEAIKFACNMLIENMGVDHD